jgi:hypothetical protein
MGGQGSGRHVNPENLFNKPSAKTNAPIGDGVLLPNYSGIKKEARKEDSTDITGGGVDWTIDQSPLQIHSANYVDNDTTYDIVTNAVAGLCPVLSDTATEYLNGQGSWTTPPDTTYTASDFNHDDLSNIPANDHIDWTISQVANIHADNYTDTNTTYTAGTGMTLDGTTFDCDITQYTDADAVSAVATSDDYLKNDANDTSSGKITAEGFDANSNKITSVADPTENQDAATKKYVDDNDSDTTYTAGTNLTLDGTEFNVDDAFLVNDANDTTTGTITAAGFNAGSGTIQTTGTITTGDHGTAATDEVVNVCYGTGDPPTASTTTIGTLFVKYTA